MTERIESMPKDVQDLYSAAKHARQNAYSPYSERKVGAAIRTSSGRIFPGCNVENSSFGATICAERTAIFAAVAEEGERPLTEVMVVTDASPPWVPCGICRQVIAEFGPDATVYMANLRGELLTDKISALFPKAFTPKNLEK